MIKSVVFDFDGVVADTEKAHFSAFNVALQRNNLEPITWTEHLTIYRGMSSREKLKELLGRRFSTTGIYHKEDLAENVLASKKRIEESILTEIIVPDPEKIEMMKELKSKGYTIGICSNSRRELLMKLTALAGFGQYINAIYGTDYEDVKAKPDPDMYLRIMKDLKVKPSETLIVEDSNVGMMAAVNSGARYCMVDSYSEVNLYTVLNKITETEKVNVIIPAAGQGKRFAEVGFVYPKPLIRVKSVSMIEMVMEMFHFADPILLFQTSHIKKYELDRYIKDINPRATVIGVDGITQGAVCTILKAEGNIDNDTELLICNSDNYTTVDINMFLFAMREAKADGGMLTFGAHDPKWSFAAYEGTIDPSLNTNILRVTEVAEKKPISDQATAGVYYFRRGSDFVKYAKQMIDKNIRVNNEFYTVPVYNELIQAGGNVYLYTMDQEEFFEMGTPEGLETTLERLS